MRVRVLTGDRSRRRRVWVLCAAAALLAVVATRPAAQVPATVGPVRPGPPTRPAEATARPPAGILAGEAVDAATGRGLDGVVVRLTCAVPGFEDARALTENNGGFAFTQVPSARCAIEATRTGYADGALGRSRPAGEPRYLDVVERAARTDLKIRLWKLGAITGLVADDRSQPIVSQPVHVFEHAMVGGRPRLRLVGETVTDDRGFYRVGRLLPGEYVVGAMTTHTTLPASVVDRYFAPGGDPEESLRQAIFRATPVITPPGSDQSLRIGDQIVQSIGRGPLPFPSPSGELLAFSTVFSPPMLNGMASPLAVGPGEERAGVDLQLVAATTARVGGRLLNDDGTPAALVPLRLVSRAEQFVEGGFDAGRTLTSADGSFTFVGVTPGEYAVRALSTDRSLAHGPEVAGVSVPATAAPMAWADQPVVVGKVDASLTVRLRPGITFSGVAQFNGSATKPTAADMASIPIVLESADRPAPDQVAPGRINPDGTFVTRGVPAGRYYLRALGAPPAWNLQGAMLNGLDLSTTPIEVSSGTVSGVRLVFSDRSAEVSGRALAQAGVVDSRAVLFPTSDRLWIDWGLNPRHIQSVRADPAGNFVFRNVPPGDYFVAAMPDASVARWSDPSTLLALARTAARVTVVPAGRHTVSVRTTEVRR